MMSKTKMIKLIYGPHYRNFRIPECYFLLQHALLSQGLSVGFSQELVPGCINVVVEGFSPEYEREVINFKRHSESRLFIICTEYLTGETLNNFSAASDQSRNHYEAQQYWQSRYQQLMRVAEYADGLFHLSELQVKPYEQAVPGVKLHYLPHGAMASMINPFQLQAKKDIDVLFTGVITEHREQQLNALKNSGLKVITCDTNTPAYLRADASSRAKVSLNLLQHSGWLHPSNSRFHYHLTNQSYLISEQTFYKCDLSPFIDEVGCGDIVEKVNDTIAENDFEFRAEQAHQDFFHVMDMQQFMPAIMDFLGVDR